jgi:PQQ-dependent dehydrogenase (s-GDH family)
MFAMLSAKTLMRGLSAASRALSRGSQSKARGAALAVGLAAGIFLPLESASADVAPPPGTPVAALPEHFDKRIVATGLDNPHNMVFGPDGQLWVTEQITKRVVRVDPKTGAVSVAVTIADATHSKGSQNGLLGLALHPNFLQHKNADYVYVSMTYTSKTTEPFPNRTLIRRYTYDAKTATLSAPLDILKDLPSSNDHQSARLLFGPDGKLYYSIGDQGANQLSYLCIPNEAQALPSEAELKANDWRHYKGKILRLNPDGSIPDDNPIIHGVRSHIFAWGIRNTQGMTFSPGGKLLSVNHGPNSDDTLNLIVAGGNLGWPNVLGFRNDLTYAYADFSGAKDACWSLKDPGQNGTNVPAIVPVHRQSEFHDPDYVAPLKTLFAADADKLQTEFNNPACADKHLYYICWPTIAPSAVAYYRKYEKGIPDWAHSVLIASLKRGVLYRVRLDPSDSVAIGDAIPLFRSTNRYREVVIAPDGRTIYVATDTEGYGQATNDAGSAAFKLENPGAILAFSYTGP